MKLSEIGIWTSYRSIGEENAGEAAKLAEDLGFGVFWLGGSPKLPTVAPLLGATASLIVADRHRQRVAERAGHARR